MKTSELIYKTAVSKITAVAENPARLAKLRRGVGKKPGELPELWEEVLEGIPEEIIGSNAENAIYASLTMFSWHMLGSSKSVHVKGRTLGKALYLLIESKNISTDGLKMKLSAMVKAKTVTEMSVYLRGIISLLRSNGIGLDYGLLAIDIFYLQTQKYKNDVTLRWARDLYKKENNHE